MSEREELNPVDPRLYRELIGNFATGVGVVTALLGEQQYAMTANSITSVSLAPPLVLVSFMRDSDTGRAVHKSGRFGLSILDSADGRDVARLCAGKLSAEGDNQLDALPTHIGPHDLPLIDGAIECLVCSVEQIHTVGDHDVVIARTEPVPAAQGSGDPLVFFDASFWQLAREAT
jgi:flavin reductase (DIM6/NTAB) family NADH-FMN oxidoreductase RutF